jgi:ribosomal protein S14
MLSSKVKDLRERNIFRVSEKSRIINKFVFFNLRSKKSSVISSLFFIKNFPNDKRSKIRLVRRCVFTNRGRGVLRPFGISRIYLREMMKFGLIPGYAKAVW